MTLFNYRMQIIRNMKPITEEQMYEEPLEVVNWFLEMEQCVMELVKLGDRGGQMSYTVFGHSTINQVIHLLPNHLENKVIGHFSEGRAKLMFTIQLMAGRRRICNKRSTSYDHLAILGLINLAPPPQDN